jgi:hypothetical protein
MFAHPRVQGEEPPDVEKLLRVSDFKRGANAKVEGREAHVIEYKVSTAGEDKAFVKLWLDARTHLPLKRELRAATGDAFRVVETYSEFKLGPKGAGLEPVKPALSGK